PMFVRSSWLDNVTGFHDDLVWAKKWWAEKESHQPLDSFIFLPLIKLGAFPTTQQPSQFVCSSGMEDNQSRHCAEFMTSH
ncbi:MAG: hypothetical protein J0M26_29840, partial [Planctomycetes bacterium]|nr:hypothetical protein [Planctomycetota bacterium]